MCTQLTRLMLMLASGLWGLSLSLGELVVPLRTYIVFRDAVTYIQLPRVPRGLHWCYKDLLFHHGLPHVEIPLSSLLRRCSFSKISFVQFPDLKTRTRAYRRGYL